MYKACIRLIPVEWLLNALNVAGLIFNFIAAVFERISSFTGAIAWNISGLDAYYVFIDDNPIPIHYPKFMIGGMYEKLWFYNVRTREFTFDRYQGVKRMYLPAITATYKCERFGEESSFDLTDFLSKTKFTTFFDIFPTPMQLVGAWSLHSGIWPSMMTGGKHTLTVMNVHTADDVDIPLGLKAEPFRWSSLNEDDSEEEEEDDDDEETVSEEESDETVSEAKAEITEEDKELVRQIFECMNTPEHQRTVSDETVISDEEVKEEVQEAKEDGDTLKVEAVENVEAAENVEADSDMHIIDEKDKEYFETVD